VSVDEVGWDDNGHWVGPRDLRVFLRTNWVFAVFWDLVLTFIALAFLFDVAKVPTWLVAPLALVLGGVATLGFMFAFSRGWIAEGD
jgi:hypothetical protein